MGKRGLRSLFIALLSFLVLTGTGFSAESKHKEPLCAVYITGIGCGNCAVTDPVLFVNATASNPDLIIVEYEIYRSRQENQQIKDQYFNHYVPGQRTGVPFLVVDKENSVIGRFKVLALAEKLAGMTASGFPRHDGEMVDFDDIDLAQLSGAPKIWTKNRVLIHGEGGNDAVLRRLVLEPDISTALKGVDYHDIEPKPVAISNSAIDFEYAVKVGNWRLQWNGSPIVMEAKEAGTMERSMILMLIALMVLAIAFSFFRVRKVKKGSPLKVEFRGRIRDFVIAATSLSALVIFLFSAKNITPDFLERIGYDLPLPVFTFFIALVDGFNPCNMFVLTCLLALLISTSGERRRLYVVALSFIGMVYVFYFMFMALWLNVFKYISFVTPLRVGIGTIAVVAGLINCKELFFFRRGFTLMIQDKHKGPLMKRIEGMKGIIQKGSLPVLITSSLGLAALASLVELPCTAGFPIIYTGILSGKGLDQTAGYYLYLAYYNMVYVLPLCVIIFIFIYTLRARQITQRQMEIIKFIGGVIMLLLGIVLLVNPGLLGLKLG